MGWLSGAALAAGGVALAAAATAFIVTPPIWLIRHVQKRVPAVVFVHRPRRAERRVALTIDDGPHQGITEELLDILRENDSQATWFLIGSNMDQWPELVRRIHEEGHEVGNHTMHDVASWRLSQDELVHQLVATEQRLAPFFWRDIDQRAIKWFRPGHGFYTKRMLDIVNSYGYRLALGSLFPVDTWFKRQGKLIARYLSWRMYPGAVIILHDREAQRSQTAELLRHLLPELRRRDYSVVTLSTLLELV